MTNFVGIFCTIEICLIFEKEIIGDPLGYIVKCTFGYCIQYLTALTILLSRIQITIPETTMIAAAKTVQLSGGVSKTTKLQNIIYKMNT